MFSSIGNGNFNLDARLNGERCDLLDDLSWALQIDDTLVDPHLIPTFRTNCQVLIQVMTALKV